MDKIWCSYRSKTNEFVLDETTDYIGLTNTTVIFDTNPDLSLKYLLALLNSSLLTFRYMSIGKPTGNGVREYFETGVGNLPIPNASKTQQDELVALVDQMMVAVKKQHNAVSEQDKRVADTLVSAIDNQINQKVYELYGITDPNDIAVIEGKSE